MTRKDLTAYCLTFSEVYEDYPFDDEWTVMRHNCNKKSFAFIYERNGKLYVNLKCDPFQADFLRSVYNDVTPGYHMNKQHWNTVYINGDVPDEKIKNMIGHSFDMIKPKAKVKNG